ncbi:MAG TPA: IS1595 family transposase [Verrucomicrobiae bacterium]|jgi:transposase|nr:IS1595 family transposase [Verrucomicrobiae bacterium]
MKDTKYTVRDFNEQFKTDADCLQYLFDQRFPNGGTCEKCGKAGCFHPMTGRRQYACAWCGFQIAPTAGTIFHKSPTSLKTWFHAMFLMTASRNGVSAMELMRQTGVTYKTAWRINHQIRQLMNVPMGQQERFGGTVEADEAYIGGVRKGKGGRGAAGKTPVVGVLRRGGKIVVKATPDVSARSLVTNICKTTKRGTTVMTDEFPSYGSLTSLGFNHKTINHSEGKYVNGNIHTNGIESFWAQLKRSISGTFHHVSSQHLQKYLNEFAYRHNHRHSETPMFARLMATAGEQRDSAV